MLGSDSIVIRVHPDGSLAPFERMPALFFDRAIRQVLDGPVQEAFETACAEAIERQLTLSFTPGDDPHSEVLINPVLDESDVVRFLVCWARQPKTPASVSHLPQAPEWTDLRLDDVTTRYRLRVDDGNTVVDAAPWWSLPTGQLVALWPEHATVSSLGLGHAVIETVIYDAVEAAAASPAAPAVRIEVPSADMLAGLVPVFHGAIRAMGLPADRVMVALDVQLAVDQDLLPIIVHLRTMGMRIDIVGLDAFTSTLHMVSDTSEHMVPLREAKRIDTSPWSTSLVDALRISA